MPVGVFWKVVSRQAGAQTHCGRPVPTDGGPALGDPVPSLSWGLAQARSVAPSQATLTATCLLQAGSLQGGCVGSQDPTEDTWLPQAGVGLEKSRIHVLEATGTVALNGFESKMSA